MKVTKQYLKKVIKESTYDAVKEFRQTYDDAGPPSAPTPQNKSVLTTDPGSDENIIDSEEIMNHIEKKNLDPRLQKRYIPVVELKDILDALDVSLYIRADEVIKILK